MPDNSLPGFQLALRLGATGLETDAFVTSDGVAVLDHDGVVGRGLRRRPVASVTHAESGLPSLDELYELCGADFELSIDIKDSTAASAVVASARARDACRRLWLCTPDLDLARQWVGEFDGCNIVHSTSRRAVRRQEEKHAAALHASGIGTVNLHHSDWSAGLVSLYHRFGINCFGWDVQFPRVVDALLDMGIDGLYSDHVDMLMSRLAPPPPGGTAT